MKKFTRIILIGLSLVLTSCKWGDYYFVDFDNVPQNGEKLFKVTSKR